MRAPAEAGAVEQQHDDAGGAAGDDGVHDGLGHRRRVALLADGRLRAPVEGQEAEQEDEAPQGGQLRRERTVNQDTGGFFFGGRKWIFSVLFVCLYVRLYWWEVYYKE